MRHDGHGSIDFPLSRILVTRWPFGP